MTACNFMEIEFVITKTEVVAKSRTLCVDYFLDENGIPQKKANRGTKVKCLPGKQKISDMSDMEYFQHNLYRGLYHGSRELNLDEDS